MERCCLIALTVAVSVAGDAVGECAGAGGGILALMKALGGSQGQLMGMFLLEALVLAVDRCGGGIFVGSARLGDQ